MDQFLIIVHNFLAFLSSLLANRVILGLAWLASQVAEVVSVLQRLGLRRDLRLVVLSSAVLLGKRSQLCELLRILEHGAIVELLGGGYITLYSQLVFTLGGACRCRPI